MAIDALGPLQSSGAPAAAGGAPATGARPDAGVPNFAALLQQKLQQPQAQLQQVRDEVSALRNGGALRAHAAASPAPPSLGGSLDGATSKLLALRQTASAGPDPYGWRAMTKSIGDSVVSPGFGTIFQQQIAQESGYAPDVALGVRKSSAGAEGIAQLMPQYYPGVDRTDPQQSLTAAAQTMRHYLEAWDGDVRKALASYNSGLGTVRAAVQARGDQWESALPAETKQYLASIVGSQDATVALPPGQSVAVFGGSDAGGVLTSPLDRVTRQQQLGALLRLVAATGSSVRAPADGTVLSVDPMSNGALSVALDNGNGWTTLLQGLAASNVSPGDAVGRLQVLGTLAGGAGGSGALGLGVQLDGGAVDPRRYLLQSQLAALGALAGDTTGGAF